METGEDNSADGDLIFVSEEHIDLEEAPDQQTEEVDEELMLATENTVEEIENGEEEEAAIQEGGEKSVEEEKVSGKDEGLMVVDEWDDNEIDSEADEEDDSVEKDKDAINPEDVERAILNMPTLKSLMEDIGHLKQNRRVVISPLSMEELNHPKITETVAWDTCEEVKVQFVRPQADLTTFTGIVVLHFTTNGSAAKAAESLKELKEGIQVKLESNTNQVMEEFVKEVRSKKRWTDNVVVIRNLTDETKLESIKEFFPEAEEIIIHKDSSKRKETTSARGYAYMVFGSEEMASSVVKENEFRKLELEGHRLFVVQYRSPVNTIPRFYLKLRERKLVLRHMDKLTRNMEKAKTDATVKLPEKAEERLEVCKSLIEKDNKCRKEVELPAPTLEELKKMQGMPVLTTADCHRLLLRLGVIKEKKRSTSDDRGRSKQQDKSSPHNKRRVPSRGRGGFKRGGSPLRGGRRSPFQNRKRNWSGRGSRSSGNMGGGMMSGGGMVNPLALMMQQNLGMMGTGGMINPGMLMQPNMMMGAAGGMLGGVNAQGMPFMGGMGGGPGHGMDDSGKMLRLDETGNFRSADDHRFQDRDHRRFDGPRGRDHDDRAGFRGGDSRHRRSRSPDRSMRGQRGDGRDYDAATGGRDVAQQRGDEPEMANPVNLLLNLSQMLSQKMEQKRQQLERDKRGPYDRADYRGGQR